MWNDNHLPYKGRQNLDIDKTNFYRTDGGSIDDAFDDLNTFVIDTGRQGGRVIIWTSVAVGLFYVVNPMIVGVMSAVETTATATSRAVKATTTLATDVGVFLEEVTLPFICGAVFYCFFKVITHP